VKFARWYFKDTYADILTNENEIFEHWRDFCIETGIPNYRDCMFVACNLESVVPSERQMNQMTFRLADIRKFIR